MVRKIVFALFLALQFSVVANIASALSVRESWIPQPPCFPCSLR